VRKLAVEAADNRLLAPELANGITRVKGVAAKGVRLGNWLTWKQAQEFLNTAIVFQPARVCRIVQFAEVAERALPRAVGGAHGFDQRPIAVVFAVLTSAVRPQKHFCLTVSWTGGGVQEGRSALHRISEMPLCRFRHLPWSGQHKSMKSGGTDEVRLAGW
jgi:hypothetical protein